MNRVRLILVGGFLGAGKTTLLWETANRLAAEGKRVGLITNDQAPDLVDTSWLSLEGIDVREVSGSCFCCNFNGLIGAANELRSSVQADVLVAEPVGSCTDLSATILQPLKDRYVDDFELSPLSVVADPLRLEAVLTDVRKSVGATGPNGGPGMHPSAVYIFRKQLEEADWIVINKMDLLSFPRRKNLQALIDAAFPGRPVHWMSAKAGIGVSEWLAKLREDSGAGLHIPEVDYDTYAEGEAVLGWLNARMELTASPGKSIEGEQICRSVLTRLQNAARGRSAEIGHIKTILQSDQGYVVGNVTSLSEPVSIGGTMKTPALCASMILNARVEMAPEELERLSRDAVTKACGSDAQATFQQLRSFRPGRPEPTHRYARVVGS